MKLTTAGSDDLRGIALGPFHLAGSYGEALEEMVNTSLFGYLDTEAT